MPAPQTFFSERLTSFLAKPKQKLVRLYTCKIHPLPILSLVLAQQTDKLLVIQGISALAANNFLYYK